MNLSPVAALVAGGALITAAACSDRQPPPQEPPAPGPVAAPSAPAALTAETINGAAYAPPPEGETTGQPANAVLVRAQVWLDRAGFSPGVIDGRYGENVRQAIAAFQRARGLAADGRLTREVWDHLESVGGPPAVASYTLTAADVAGPFTPSIPDSLEGQAGLERLAYTGPAERIAERFHMDEQFLRALNPGVDFTRAGTVVRVANPARPALAGQVARIEVDRDEKAVKAFDAEGHLLAFYPATIGSSEQPTPGGEMTVNGVARDPTYTYDPARVSYAGDEITRRLTIAAGPNNPVGSVWIDLSRETYGIHGTPNPDVVGKTASNGCVRLTNWDALALAAAVRPGVEVVFV